MKCDLCSANATVFLTQLFDGEIKKNKFCQSCADSQGVTDPTGFALTDFLGLPTEPSQEDNPEADQPAIELDVSSPSLEECPNCGFTLEKLRKVGRLGCSQCYQSFGQEITPMLRNMHGATTHKGKIPDLKVPAKPSGEELKALQKQLDAAIAKEDYEQAAVLHEQIKQLQST